MNCQKGYFGVALCHCLIQTRNNLINNWKDNRKSISIVTSYYGSYSIITRQECIQFHIFWLIFFWNVSAIFTILRSDNIINIRAYRPPPRMQGLFLTSTMGVAKILRIKINNREVSQAVYRTILLINGISDNNRYWISEYAKTSYKILSQQFGITSTRLFSRYSELINFTSLFCNLFYKFVSHE